MLTIIIAVVAIATAPVQKPKGPPKILDAEQRKALARITSKGFITQQKDLPDGRKELTWTNGKDTIVTTQKVERVNGSKAHDPRREELEAVKEELKAMKAKEAKQKESAETLEVKPESK